MDRGNYRHGRGQGRGYYEQGQGQGRGGGRGGRSVNQPPFQSPQQWGNQPRQSGQFQHSGAPYNQLVSQNPGRGGGTALPRSPQQQGSDVPTSGWPQLPQQQDSGVSSTDWPQLPQQQVSGVSSTAWPQLPQQQDSGGGGGNAWARPLPQQQGRGGRFGTVWPRPPPQQKGSGGVGTALGRPPQQRQQHGGGNEQLQVVDRPPSLPQSDDQAPVNLGTLINFKDPKSSEETRVPMARPDTGNNSGKPIKLFANHFPVTFNPQNTILHYDVNIQLSADENRPGEESINKSDLWKIREKLCADMPDDFPIDKTVYDGEKNIFSAVELPERTFIVKCSVGDAADEECVYKYTVKLVADLKLCKLNEYLRGNFSYIPRDILQGMDLVMKANPSRCRNSVGRCFYSKVPKTDKGCGIAVHEGFQQSLKPTSGGLALCLDYSFVELVKPMSVLDFLKEFFREPIKDIFKNKREAASNVLAGLKITVSHRRTKQKFLIKKLTEENTRTLTFLLDDQGNTGSGMLVHLVDYFRTKYNIEVKFKDFPSLQIGKSNKLNYVPIEFCSLVGGQRYSKDKTRPLNLSRPSLAQPQKRKTTICEMVQAQDGPCGAITHNFEIEVAKDMTCILGRILPAPVLKLGGQRRAVMNDKCEWNFFRETVVEGKKLQRWALIDFSSNQHNLLLKLDVDRFVRGLRDRCKMLGINMEKPTTVHSSGMDVLTTVVGVERLLRDVVKEADRKIKGGLQMIVCVMTSKHKGYKYLKWVSETKIGIVTQCCLSRNANKGQGQYLANLCMKINAKLGGSNMELMERLPNFRSEDNVMFIGADVNHPAAKDDKCPSIAAVVATVNWPAANKYAARVCPQKHRTEKILNFGDMCNVLVKTYAKLNSVKPNRIVVFRDGVSESQFDMVLNEELLDMANKISSDRYQPAITLVVAQKRHNTRLFPMGGPDNVHPGTAVDTKIVHPSDFDFYLCSHFGQLGTSKPTHYHVLWDDNHFSSNNLQQLIYNMCFTFARCTKPVSLVPPVYYADLVAYRARMFQEVLMEMKSNSSNAASSGDSFQENFYELHRDLKNIMFFV